ncbi:gluconokinase [Georgenia alba]|uniref:Gluconokinase n=1 Tax=Georgenia alba TaxID=2233858 RepID=A0ABW2Q893_9MICO
MRVQHIVVMGVSGSGKTTIATGLAEELGHTFAEGDDFHSDANREKMRTGVPLDDNDRAPWLATIRDWMTERARAGRSTVVTCSALRRRYRDVLRGAEGETIFVHLDPPEEVTAARMERRRGHYMPASLLRSQLDTLEELGPDENGVRISGVGGPESILEETLAALRRRSA